MKIIKKILFYSLVFLILSSCKNENKSCNSCSEDTNEVKTDSVETNKNAGLNQALSNEKVTKESQEQVENLKKIEKKYGEQWDFCTCVLANDSINKAFSKKISDSQAEKLMARWEYVELKCKEFLTQPNTTPEERIAHEKKVKRCLRSKR